jgi:predicted RNA binding protein YcfA (HicA-like mRNA interferase family)
MRPSRTWQAILQGNRNIGFRDFERLLNAFGFLSVGQEGSHRHWKHPQTGARMNVQSHKGQAKPYQLKQLRDLVHQFGLSLDD